MMDNKVKNMEHEVEVEESYGRSCNLKWRRWKSRHEVLNKPYNMNDSDYKNKSIMHHKMRHNSHCCAKGTTVIPIPRSRA
ncbi:unnamed protein product [Camellia sinensis]